MMTVLRLGGVTTVRWVEMSVVVSLRIVSKAVLTMWRVRGFGCGEESLGLR